MPRTARRSDAIPVTENQLLEAVLSLAKLYNWRTLHIRPARTEKGWRSPVQGDGKGFPDLLLLKDNRMLVVELKAARGKLTKDQDEWLEAFYWADAEIDTWRPADWTSGKILATLKSASPASLDQENRT